MKFSLSPHAWAAPVRIACGALALLLAIAAPSIALAEPVAEQAPVSEQPAAPATPAAPNAEPGVAPEAAAGEVSATQQAFQEKLSALGENPSTEQLQQFYQEQGLSAEMIETLMAAQPAADDALLPMHDLSPWGMYQGADIVVKAVMIGLIIASIITWTIWVAKSIELIRARRRLNREIAQFKGSRTLKQAAEQERGRNSLGQLLVDDAQDELNLSIKSTDKDAIKERVSFRLERLVAASGRQMSQGTGMLATIGSTAPFVGLFGTVWGIMNSFIGIAKSQTTNLAVVAPGIAEALLATALGLVAAIPAVVIYNVFARSITGYKAQVADASAQILLLVSRDMDHQPPADRQNAPHVVKVG